MVGQTSSVVVVVIPIEFLSGLCVEDGCLAPLCRFVAPCSSFRRRKMSRLRHQDDSCKVISIGFCRSTPLSQVTLVLVPPNVRDVHNRTYFRNYKSDNWSELPREIKLSELVTSQYIQEKPPISLNAGINFSTTDGSQRHKYSRTLSPDLAGPCAMH